MLWSPDYLGKLEELPRAIESYDLLLVDTCALGLSNDRLAEIKKARTNQDFTVLRKPVEREVEALLWQLEQFRRLPAHTTPKVREEMRKKLLYFALSQDYLNGKRGKSRTAEECLDLLSQQVTALGRIRRCLRRYDSAIPFLENESPADLEIVGAGIHAAYQGKRVAVLTRDSDLVRIFCRYLSGLGRDQRKEELEQRVSLFGMRKGKKGMVRRVHYREALEGYQEFMTERRIDLRKERLAKLERITSNVA